MSRKNSESKPTSYGFDKFMDDLLKREKSNEDRLKTLRESDKRNPMRERNRLNREDWASRIRWQKKIK